MFRARRPWVLALCVLFAYGMQLSAALAAPPQGLTPCRDDHPAHVDLSHIPPCQKEEPSEEVPPVEQPPAEEPSTDPPASSDPPPCTEDHPAVPDLSHLPPCHDETPEAEDPPAEEPPAEVPPVEEPPADEPDPSVSNDLPPCTEDHPAMPDLSDIPPCQDETPEADDPPADEPPADQAASDPSEPTASDDPSEPPPHEEQPAPPEEPFAEQPHQPSVEAMPGEDLSTEEPPSEELVAEDAPDKQAPADRPATPATTDPPLTDSDSDDDLPPPALPSEPAAQDHKEVPIELTTRAGGGLTIDISHFVHEAGAFTALAHVSPTSGTLSVAGFVATYTPNPGFYGVDTFTIRVCDLSAVCLDISAYVTVPPINDFLLTTGAALAEFFSGGSSTPGTYNELNLLPGTAQRVTVPLAGLAALVGASLWFGLDSVSSVLRRWLAVLAAKS